MILNEKFDVSPPIVRGFFRRADYGYMVAPILNEPRGGAPIVNSDNFWRSASYVMA